ncbi:hypothetical protein [Pseudobacter ginsenosidimutans]|uniref:Uncharacterized protein n=1 Tax=Pseudobacter ginsenosidimutans TaxID=661488 RepID=A0A4Q7N645_9BACT|nr:hypothetical protein [Pseudobacter ginsenosidimutans]QEC45049.1 hypothetical protein FSB84_26430 [Pseudobacter ginsenosidimutans]RZS76543.1 hypothetical protein EV199_2429 [Pseudobacter ginsenosidimutans]
MQLPLIALILIISLTVISAYRLFRQKRVEKAPSSLWMSGRKARWLLYSGLMLLGVSMGIITGITIAAVFELADILTWLIIVCILFFTGICAFICHRIEKKEK